MKQPLNEQFRRMQKLAGILNENQYNLQPIESILLTDVSPEEKMNKIGAYLTDTEDGLVLSNTNLGDIVDEWFSTKNKNNADRWLSQIQSLINTPKEIKDVSSDLTENQINEYGESGIYKDIEDDLMNGEFESEQEQIEYLQGIIDFCQEQIASLSKG